VWAHSLTSSANDTEPLFLKQDRFEKKGLERDGEVMGVHSMKGCETNGMLYHDSHLQFLRATNLINCVSIMEGGVAMHPELINKN